MSISETISFDKDGNVSSAPPAGGWRITWFRKLFLSIVIILVAFLSFGIGQLSVAENREPIKIEYDEQITTNGLQSTLNEGEVVASKNGTKYHYLHCSGAKLIKEENKIVFQTSEIAEAAGYTLATNCKLR